MNISQRIRNAGPGRLPVLVLLALCAWVPVASAITLYNFNWGTAAATWPLAGWANTNYPGVGNNTWPASNGGGGTGSCNVANGTRSSSSTFTNVNASGIDIKVTLSITNGCFVRSTAGVEANGGPAGPELRFDANGGTAAGCTGGTTSCPDLGLFVDFTGTAGHTVTITFQFYTTGTTTISPVSLQGFPVRDIDFTSGQYQDQIGLTAVNHTGGATINPDGISPFTTTPNYTIAAPLVTGINANVAVTDPNGWVSFNFATHLIDSMTLTYSDPASLANPGQQQVLLGGFVFSTTALATRAVISDVRAYEDDGQSWMEWETASEIGTVGFNIYRLDPATDSFVRLNDHLLPALGGARQGGVYRFPDPNAAPGQISTYGLEEVEAKGSKHVYGPYAVTASVGRPAPRKAVETRAPSDGSRAGHTDHFERAPHVLDAGVSATPTATEGKVARAAAQKPTPARKAGTTIRIQVEQEGLYAVTTEQIAAALGAPLAQAQTWIISGQLRLRQRGEVIPWKADPGKGRLYFYGQAVDGIDSVYTRYNVYWLDHAPGLAMGIVDAPPSASLPNGSPFASQVHVARNVKPLYWLVTDPDADFWYWDYVETDAGATSFSVPLSDVANAGVATLTISMLGASDDDRSAHIILNPSSQNCDLGASPSWHGIAPQVFTSAPFSASCLNSGDNTVAVESTAAPGTDSFLWVKGFDVDYPRNFHAVDDQLRFRGAGNPVVSVDGFSGTDIAVLDTTDPRKPQWLSGATVSAASGNGSAVSFSPAANRKYAAALAQAPVALVGDTPTTWKSNKNSAAYLTLAPSSLRPGADALAAYRDATVVELQDIYDEFNYGIANPHAIHDFLAYAATSWKSGPRFVALLGKGTIDPKDYLGYGGNLFPVLMVSTPDGLFNSDNQFADFNGDRVPDIAIGRIPALVPGDVVNYVAKLAAYESKSRGPTNQALLAADNPDIDAGDFTIFNNAVAQALQADKIATTVLNRSALPSGSAVRAQIISTLNSSAGVGVFNYVGHGAFDQLGFEVGDPLFTNDDVGLLTNGARLPIFTAFTCEVGDGTYPGTISLTETMLWRQGGGAVAAFVPNALSDSNQAQVLNLSLVNALYGPQPSATLGEAAVAALREFANQGGQRYIVDIYQVVGDPALRLRH